MVPPRAETPPPKYEKIPRNIRRADPNGAGLGVTLPIHGHVVEGSNKTLWKTKAGIIILSVLITTVVVGSILGTILGLCVSRPGTVTMTTVLVPNGMAGVRTTIIVSPPSALGQGVGGPGTTLLPGLSISSPGGEGSRASQTGEASVRGTPTDQNAGSGNSGESGNTFTFGGVTSQASLTVEASSLGTSIISNSGVGSGGDGTTSTVNSIPGSKGIVKVITKPVTITSNDPLGITVNTNPRTSTSANPQISAGIIPPAAVEESSSVQTSPKTTLEINTSASVSPRPASPGTTAGS